MAFPFLDKLWEELGLCSSEKKWKIYSVLEVLILSLKESKNHQASRRKAILSLADVTSDLKSVTKTRRRSTLELVFGFGAECATWLKVDLDQYIPASGVKACSPFSMISLIITNSNTTISFANSFSIPRWKLLPGISEVKVAQSCLTLCDIIDCSLPSSSVQRILQARIMERVAVSFLQGILPTQGLNPGLLHCRWILYSLSCQGNPSKHKTQTTVEVCGLISGGSTISKRYHFWSEGHWCWGEMSLNLRF